jgi:hypothetical protein
VIDIEKINQNLLEVKFPPIICYKHPSLDLVFYPHQKCGSTTYRALFQELNWLVIDISDINWDKDKVFAHIKDPLVRHRKGIVEGISNYFTEFTDMFKDPLAAKFLTNVTIVESHSYTIEKWLGRDRAVLVNWIPIDTSLNHVEETFKFLKVSGATVPDNVQQWFSNLPKRNESTPDELLLYNRLMAEETPGEILRFIDFDRCLYGQVLDYYGFEPNNYRQRVDQLKLTGLTELEAQNIADQEVASGKYLEWNTKGILSC